ncbi:MAG: glycosyltransferase [Pseudomonadales bacterium]
MVVSEFPTVSETFIVNQIVGLIRLGHHVDIFSLNRPRDCPVHGDISRYRLLDRTHYLRHDSMSARMVSAIRHLAVTPQWLSARGVSRALLILRTNTRQTRLSRSALTTMVSRELRSGPYDIVHCQFGNLGQRWVPVMRSGLLHGALVTSIRGHDATQKDRYNTGYYRELFRNSRLLMPVSRSLAERLLSLGCSPHKIQVLHSGIDCQRFHFRCRKRAGPEPVRILSVARLVEMKGIEYGIEAVARMLRSGSEVHYDIVGDGPLRPQLQALIQRLGVTASVRIHGWKPHEELVAILQAAHLFLAPSVTAENGETEGIPNAVKEAMAVGLPVVATRHSGIPELVIDEVSGFLVPERDCDALAAALTKLLNAPGRWPAMGQAGRAHVESEFDTNRLNQRLVDLYRAALDEART